MRLYSAFLLLLLSQVVVSAQADRNNLISVKTDSPVVREDNFGTSFTMSEDEYQKILGKLSDSPNFIAIKRKPKDISAGAGFGLNLSVNGKNVGWILDGGESTGYKLYADWNADGDLTNDAPVKFNQIGDTYRYSGILTETVGGKLRKYPYQLKLELAKVVPTGKNEGILALRIYDGTLRHGVLNINDRQISFALSGIQGIYNYDYNELFFDLNGDGKLDTETRLSPESYKISEKFVNLDETSYEFSVDRFGESLVLKALAKKLPARADLTPGNFAPDFEFRDLDGNLHKISDFRGKIVLLDFWALWCAPCVAEAPNLAAAYKTMKESGFEVVSFNAGDDIEKLRQFIGEKKMNWTHSQINDEIKKLYRTDSFPTYFLLDGEGKIISNTMRPGEEMYKKVVELIKK